MTKSRISLEKFVKEYSVRNKLNEDIPVYSVTNSQGFCTEYFSKEVASQDKTTYKIVPRGYFAYNPSRINVGSVDWQKYEDRVIVSPLYNVFSVSDEIDCQYLYYFFRSNIGRQMIKAKSSGSVRDNLKIEMLKEMTIPDISMREQQFCSSVLDKLQILIKLKCDEIKQMDELVKARFVEMFGDLRDNGKGWEIKTLDELSYLITDGEHITPRRTTDGIYLLSARNILNHSLRLDDVDYIDQEEYDRIAKRVVPKKGDVLISCSGTIGRCCSVPAGITFQMVRSVALIRFKEEINPVFAEYMITSDYLQAQINGSKTASSQSNLFQGKIRALKGFAPPIELQIQFLQFVQQIAKSKLQVYQYMMANHRKHRKSRMIRQQPEGHNTFASGDSCFCAAKVVPEALSSITASVKWLSDKRYYCVRLTHQIGPLSRTEQKSL